MPRSSPFSINLSPSEKSELQSRARTYTLPYFQVIRAKIVLLSAQGYGNEAISHRLSIGRDVVSQWRKRFYTARLLGLDDLPRSGRPKCPTR